MLEFLASTTFVSFPIFIFKQVQKVAEDDMFYQLKRGLIFHLIINVSFNPLF